MSLPEPNEYWAAHRQDTRERILRAYVGLLEHESAATVSMPAVAERAGLSVRTLYRYFPNKDALVSGVLTWFDEHAREAVGTQRVGLDNFQPFLTQLWRDFAEKLDVVRAQHVSPGGRELRARRLVQARAELAAALPGTIAAERRADVIDAVIALGSSAMFLELVDRMGHSPDHAATLAAHLTRLVVADAIDDTSHTTSSQNGAPR